MWRQQVSTNPATRLEVVNLQEQLDMRLQQRQVFDQAGWKEKSVFFCLDIITYLACIF